MTARITDILGGLQAASMATFVDLPNLAALGLINMGSGIFRQAMIPMVADNSLLGAFLVGCVNGSTDLVKWYYLKGMASMPTGSAGPVV